MDGMFECIYRLAEQFGLSRETIDQYEREEFEGILSDREAVEEAFGERLIRESEGGWGE